MIAHGGQQCLWTCDGMLPASHFTCRQIGAVPHDTSGCFSARGSYIAIIYVVVHAVHEVVLLRDNAPVNRCIRKSC